MADPFEWVVSHQQLKVFVHLLSSFLNIGTRVQSGPHLQRDEITFHAGKVTLFNVSRSILYSFCSFETREIQQGGKQSEIVLRLCLAAAISAISLKC